jgi:hypothetical protein
VLNFLIAQCERFEPKVVFFDKDRGAEIFLRAMGGKYDLIRPGARRQASIRCSFPTRRAIAASCSNGRRSW